MRFDRRISRRSFLAAAGVTSAALVLTACGSSSSVAASSASGTASSAAGTAQGGTLNIMLETEVQSLDPQIATDGTSFEVIADYTDGLMQMDADGAAVPAIAETYEISEDGKTYTFHLRDVKWSNGDAVTAADFVFGWQRAVDPANASEYSYMLSDIGQVVNAAEIIAGEKPVTDLGVTAVDDKTLEVQLNVPVSYFLSLMYFPTFYPVNEAFFNTCKDTFGTSPDTVLSNGAFKLTDYQPAATAFTLEKNPDYYDAIIDECTTGDLCTDPEGRWAALYEAEQIILEQAVIFPLYGQCNAEMVSSAVTGVEFHPVALNRVYKNAAKSV